MNLVFSAKKGSLPLTMTVGEQGSKAREGKKTKKQVILQTFRTEAYEANAYPKPSRAQNILSDFSIPGWDTPVIG